jgi:hypothetical protein
MLGKTSKRNTTLKEVIGKESGAKKVDMPYLESNFVDYFVWCVLREFVYFDASMKIYLRSFGKARDRSFVWVFLTEDLDGRNMKTGQHKRALDECLFHIY